MLTLDLPLETYRWHFVLALSLRLAMKFGDDFLLWDFSDEPTGRGCPVMARSGRSYVNGISWDNE
jgi:hypothetical protein